MLDPSVTCTCGLELGQQLQGGVDKDTLAMFRA